LEAQCRKSDSVCRTDGQHTIITTRYLGRDCDIRLPEVEFIPPDGGEDLALRDKILVLHYLVQAKGPPLSGNLISYKDLKEGTVYFPSFYKRAIKPLVDSFGRSPEKLAEAARNVNGLKANYGDAGVLVPAFPRVPVTIVLWKGDDEFPPEGNILFDSTVSDYLSTEDINILCQTIAWKIAK
jgi:hypothetical protein